MRKELNAEEIAKLAPYERQMRTATEARWVSHIPQSGIDTFLAVWKSLTGTDRVFRQGCGTCILNLVADLGTLYFKAQEKPNNGEAKSKPAEAAEAPKAVKTTSKRRIRGKAGQCCMTFPKRWMWNASAQSWNTI